MLPICSDCTLSSYDWGLALYAHLKALALLGKGGEREYLLGFAQQDALVAVACREVADDEATCACCLGDVCCVASRAVPILLGPEGIGIDVGGFVIKEGDTFHLLCQARQIARVADIGIGAGWSCWRGEMLVGVVGAVIGVPAFAVLDAVDGVVGYADSVYHVAADVG